MLTREKYEFLDALEAWIESIINDMKSEHSEDSLQRSELKEIVKEKLECL